MVNQTFNRCVESCPERCVDQLIAVHGTKMPHTITPISLVNTHHRWRTARPVPCRHSTSALQMHEPDAHVGQPRYLLKAVHDQHAHGRGSSCSCSITILPSSGTLHYCTTCKSCIRSGAVRDIPPQRLRRNQAREVLQSHWRSKQVLHPHSPQRSCRPCAQLPLTWTACTFPCPRSAPRIVRRCPWSTRTPGST
jgi:ferredoxin